MEAELNLKNQFLLAMPGLTGTYFGNTLTYICEHNDEGAMGIIINRPSELSVVELLSQLNIDASRIDIEIPVMEGGPVGPERGFILHTDDVHFEASLALENGLMLSAAREVLEAISSGEGPEHYLVAMGYAGWEQGQIEAEVMDNSWLTCPAVHEIVFNTAYAERIDAAAASLGIDFKLMSGHAGHA